MSTETVLRGLIERYVEISDPDEPLEMESLEVVQLSEAIERTFGLRVPATDLVPENFGTLGRLVAYVDRQSTA